MNGVHCVSAARTPFAQCFQCSATSLPHLVVTMTPSAFVRAVGTQCQLLECCGGPGQLLFCTDSSV
eukprot:19664-Prorocentrum_lima.AAC.1